MLKFMDTLFGDVKCPITKSVNTWLDVASFFDCSGCFLFKSNSGTMCLVPSENITITLKQTKNISSFQGTPNCQQRIYISPEEAFLTK